MSDGTITGLICFCITVSALVMGYSAGWLHGVAYARRQHFKENP